MKIAQLSGNFDTKYYSSNESFLCHELAKLGHKVVMFTAAKQPRWQIVRKVRNEYKSYKSDSFSVKRLPVGLEIGNVSMMPTLFPQLLKGGFDIIHSHDFYTSFSFYGAMASQLKNVPLIITQHNDVLPQPAVRRLLYRFNGITFGNFVFNRAKKIIALTRDIKQHLLQMGASEKKITIIPTAVDTERFSPSNRNLLEEIWGISPPVVLFVGRLVEEKGLEYLIRAFSGVVREVPETKLVIIGKGPKEAELRRLQEELKIPNIFFLGMIENVIMPNIYVGASVIVLPSIIEPFGNVVLEAMASGKPVIGSYVGGLKDIIVHGVTGYHVQARNSKQIQRAILKVLCNKSLLEKLEYYARRRAVNYYDSKLLIGKIEKLYSKVLDNTT